MILDTSVLVAILQREPGWQHHQRQLEDAPRLLLSAGTMQELLIVAHCRGVLDAMEALLQLLDPDVVPVDEALARRALQMFQRMGKGPGHAAQLNFGDCFAAALADQEQLPLAFAGEDFKAAGF
jgi:ribonuclease VapC